MKPIECPHLSDNLICVDCLEDDKPNYRKITQILHDWLKDLPKCDRCFNIATRGHYAGDACDDHQPNNQFADAVDHPWASLIRNLKERK